MALAQFHPSPGWDSRENQGANVAVASLQGDGSQDLVVLRVDAPPGGPNTASYRVGTPVVADGSVGDWGPWLPVPGWDSVRDDGAGIAVADFGAAGLGLVVLQVRSGADVAANDGRYRIGRRLDSTGQVQGGWSDWQDVPGWQSFRDQGAAVAVADLDGDGRPEIVVFHVDDFHTDHQDPALPNRGLYRVGRALADDGTVTDWSDWHSIDWESFFNQGGGVAVADLTGTGPSDLVVFQIDDPQGENRGRYRIGWNLDVQGTVQDGWGPWVDIDGWGSWEDAGGGIALATFTAGQRPRAVVLHVDNLPQLNNALYAVLDLVLDIDQAPTLGVWRLLPYPSQVLPVHAALLHTGKILFFAGSGNNVVRRSSPDFGNEARAVYTSVVWDVVANTFDHPPTLRRPDGRVVDYFCCGHCALPDGRLLVAGGTDQYDMVLVDGRPQDAGHGFTGLTDAMVFDPTTEAWTRVQSMGTGRWYPTVVMLQDGHAVATSGLDANSNIAQAFETIVDPDTDAWAPGRAFVLPLYPHLFLLKNGQLIYTGGKMDTAGVSVPLVFDPLLPTQAGVITGLSCFAVLRGCWQVRGSWRRAGDGQVRDLGG